MQSILNWQKGIFSCTYQVLLGGRQIGQLKDSEWSRFAHGHMLNTFLTFKICNGLRDTASIVDTESQRQIGTIRFSLWYPKARIEYGDQLAYWKFSNLWECNWKIYRGHTTLITLRGWRSKGTLENQHLDEVLVLAGLYVANYYRRLTAVLIASFLPLVWFIL